MPLFSTGGSGRVVLMPRLIDVSDDVPEYLHITEIEVEIETAEELEIE